MADQAQQALPPDGKKWLDAISAYDREFQKWEKRADRITKQYRDFDSAQDTAKTQTTSFNILWSNIQVLMPATFARLPKPDVSRRFRDNDPVGRVAALLLERALTFELDHYPDYRSTMKNSVLDRFLGGRGTSWVRYEPHIINVPVATEELQVTDDADEADTGEAQGAEEIDYECAPTDYVHRQDFGHAIARTWEEVTSVWRRVFMNRAKLVERFGEDIGNRIPLDIRQKADGTAMKVNDGSGDTSMQAAIYEIWDKATGNAIWFNKTIGVLETKPDPLGLENFFPCPRPLYATTTPESLIPVPDFKIYQDQAQQLNKLAAKIDGLIDMLVVKGVYDAAIPELARLFKEAGNGDLIAVKNFQAFAEKNGLSGSIDIFDITPIVAALNQAYTTVEQVKNEIYELMGVSDIARGASDPTETYGAQKLKGSFGNMRLRSKQEEVTLYATELLQIKAQIMCQHFQPATFLQIAAADQLDPADQQYIEPAIVLLMGQRAIDPSADTTQGPLSAFRIEVSSDSMVQMDEQQEKGDRLEFIQTFTGFLEKVIPAVKDNPQLAPLAVSMLKFGVSGFKVGKTMEGMIDQVLDQMVKQAAQPQQPKPDPEMEKIQAQMQLEDKKLANAMQLGQAKAQADAALAANEQQVQAQQNAHQNQLEAARAQQQAEIDASLETQRMQFETMLSDRDAERQKELESMRGQIDVLLARLNNEAKLEVAELGAATTLQAAQVSAASSASEEKE